MLQAFVITFREGLEAFLIVAISLAFLRKSGNRQLVTAVQWGIGVSVVSSVIAGWLLSRAASQSWWEGILALAAAVSVAMLTVHMWKTARRLKGEIEGRLQESAAKQGPAAWLGVFLFTLLMISREGMETVLLMGTLIFQVRAFDIVGGAVAGVAAAAAVAWIWSRFGHRVNLALFFQVTAIFLLIFVVQLLVHGFHELAEANVLPDSERWHAATEPYGPDGRYGQYLGFLLVAGPLAWLLLAMTRRPRLAR